MHSVPFDISVSGAEDRTADVAVLSNSQQHSLEMLNQDIPTTKSEDVITPVDPQKLQAWLHDYPAEEKRFLLQRFTEGFKIPFQGKHTFKASTNLKSALNNPEVLRQKNYKRDKSRTNFWTIPVYPI